jgi:glycosyltransferase involved in cell wall biosynthesis
MVFHEHLVRKFYYDCTFFCLTSFERDFLINLGISKNKALILPNGVNCKKFNSVEKEFVKNKELSICLGKIDARKRQSILQKQIQSIAFVGECHDSDFDDKSENYLGPWTTEEVQQNLTHYGNLVLLSSSELQPLVCLEAMSAGLGLVVSEVSSQNLDVNKEFITVIPDEFINDVKYIKNKIEQNRIVSLNSREEITSYASQFDWLKIAEKWLELNEKTT